MKLTFIEWFIVFVMIMLIAIALTPLGPDRYKDVCHGGVLYIKDIGCSKCSLTPKIDPQTLQPQRCQVEKGP